MQTRRTAKVSEAIRQVVSSAILIDLRDPRVKNVTVLHVEVPTDLRTAKVYVSILGDEKAERLSLQGLNAARGWIQSRIADQLQLRLTPVLTFISDQGVKKSVEVAKMLREINGEPVGELEPVQFETGDDEAADYEDELDQLDESEEEETPTHPQPEPITLIANEELTAKEDETTEKIGKSEDLKREDHGDREPSVAE